MLCNNTFVLGYALRDIELPVKYIDKESGNEKIAMHKILKGNGVVVHVHTYHRLKRIWGENALEFDPMRFYSINENDVQYYAGLNKYSNYQFPVFNIQPRLCLGRPLAIMQAKTVAVKLLRKFDVSISSETAQSTTYQLSFVLQIKDGLRINIANRCQA